MTNNSKIYYDGSKWMSNNYGEFEIVGKIDKKEYYLCRFEDGTIVSAHMSSIKSGEVRNPNRPSVFDVGYIGIGKHIASVSGKVSKEYSLWKRMLQRSYDSKFHEKCPTYKECSVDPHWHNFQLFCEDIEHLENYDNWKNDTNKRNKWELDKDKLIKGNKIYSKENCCFITQKENSQLSSITGLSYLGTRISDNYTEEFTNQSEFARKWNLYVESINHCIKGKYKTSKGWTFKVMEEKS